MQYDGKGKIDDALASLYGLSVNDKELVNKLRADATQGLGFTEDDWPSSRAELINMKLKIYQWHYDKINSVQHVKQDGDNASKPIQKITVQNIERDDFQHIHFGLTITHNGKPKRTSVMLEGYLLKALQRKHGLSDNPAIRVWIEQGLIADASRFNSMEPLTRQVKRLIIESLV